MEFLFIRTAFLGISSFTFLNSVKILHIPLHFPWLVLFVLSFGIWLFWEKIYKKRFNFPMFMGSFFLFQLYTDTLGNVFELYRKFNWYDKLSHFIGGATTGALVILVLSYFSKKNQWKISLKTLAIFAISLALSLAVLYELWELFEYSVLNYKLIIIGVTDTADDLLFGFLGTITSVLLLITILKKRGYFFTRAAAKGEEEDLSFSTPNNSDSKTK